MLRRLSLILALSAVLGGCALVASVTGSMFRPGRIHVTTGTLDWTGGGQVSTAQRTMAAPGYEPITGDRDAAIIELARPTRAPAVALATPSDRSLQAGGSPVVIAGWGLTDAGDDSSQPAALQWAPTVVRSRSWCARRWAPFDGTDELCTIDSPQDTTSFCNGDSGGPVIADEFSGQSGEPTEIGVIDDSQSCATDAPDFSARVAAISEWARRAIAQYPARVSARARRVR